MTGVSFCRATHVSTRLSPCGSAGGTRCDKESPGTTSGSGFPRRCPHGARTRASLACPPVWVREGAGLARTVDDVRRYPAGPGASAQPRGRGVRPRGHDAVPGRDRRRDRDRPSRRLLPDGERGRSSRPSARSTAAATPSTRSRPSRSSSAGGPSRRSAVTSRSTTSSSACPTPAAAPSYARIVAETALLRRLICAAADIMEMAYSPAGGARTGRRRGRAADLRRRAPRREGAGRDAQRARRPGDRRPREDPEPRLPVRRRRRRGSATSTACCRDCRPAT